MDGKTGNYNAKMMKTKKLMQLLSKQITTKLVQTLPEPRFLKGEFWEKTSCMN